MQHDTSIWRQVEAETVDADARLGSNPDELGFSQFRVKGQVSRLGRNSGWGWGQYLAVGQNRFGW